MARREQEVGYENNNNSKPESEEINKPSTVDKVKNGVNVVALVLVGGFWAIAPIVFAISTKLGERYLFPSMASMFCPVC